MNEVYEAMMHRRSVRQYTGESVSREQLDEILTAALVSPTGKNSRSCSFICVTDREVLDKMALCRKGGVSMLRKAGAAIVALSDVGKTDTTVEDASIAMAYMHLLADSMGLGSCWVQCRLRIADTGDSTEQYLRNLLGFGENLVPVAILSIGIPENRPNPHTAEDADFSKVLYV